MAETWYRQEAAKYRRLAENAASPEQRAQYPHEAELWLQIADDVEATPSSLDGTWPSGRWRGLPSRA
jgi:hypothetical protein